MFVMYVCLVAFVVSCAMFVYALGRLLYPLVLRFVMWLLYGDWYFD